MLGGIVGKRRRGWQRMRWLDGITDSMDVSLQWTLGDGGGQGGLAGCASWGRKELDTTERLNWCDLYCFSRFCLLIYALIPMFVFLFLTHFTLYHSLSILPCHHAWPRFTAFCGWVIFRCVHVAHLLSPLIHGCTSGGSHVLAVVHSAAVNTGARVSFWIKTFSVCMPTSGIAGSYGITV